MIKHHTITHQDPKEFDKLCTKFLNENKDNEIGVDYFTSTIPIQVQAPPVNIPEFKNMQQQQQIAWVTTYSAFYKVTVPEEVPFKN